ncbi:MAG: hypothetical protein AAF587_01990 [Bacteroidota bacterium]
MLAQKSIRDSSISLVVLDISYRGYFPAGDMTERFGFTSVMGVDLSYKLSSNYYLSGGFHFLFADSVDMSGILDPLLTPGGFLVTDNGLLSDVRTLGSGFVVPISVGKIFPIIKAHNSNSGLFVEIGGQFLQHKLVIQPREDEVAGLEGEYIKGYDRLTNGIGIREGIGYRYFASNGMVNFAIGLDMSQNFTQSRRSVDFSTGLSDSRQRLDLLFGIRASWTFPLYKRAPNKAYYN